MIKVKKSKNQAVKLNRDQTTSFRINSHVKAAADAYAAQNGISFSDLLNELITRELRENNIEITLSIRAV